MCSATAERKSTILVTFSAYHRQHHGFDKVSFDGESNSKCTSNQVLAVPCCASTNLVTLHSRHALIRIRDTKALARIARSVFFKKENDGP